MLILPIVLMCPLKLPHRDARKNKRRIFFDLKENTSVASKIVTEIGSSQALRNGRE
jgi:hypothetical protein